MHRLASKRQNRLLLEVTATSALNVIVTVGGTMAISYFGGKNKLNCLRETSIESLI